MSKLASNYRELDVSLLGTVFRRARFVAQYISARIQQDSIQGLLPIVEKTFDHPWVAGVDLQIRSWHGHPRSWPWNQAPQEPTMHWDAPITISVFRKRRGKRRLAFCLSLFVIRNELYIKQIQGVSRTDAPAELSAWPRMFIEACREFAQRRRFKSVNLAKAATLYSYNNPSLNRTLLPDARERALGRVRRDMGQLYDTNARALGFTLDGDWFKWTNPEINGAPPPKAAGLKRWFVRRGTQIFALALSPVFTDIECSFETYESRFLTKEPTFAAFMAESERTFAR